MSEERSSRPDVRNPILRLDSIERAARLFAELPPEVQRAWLDLFREISDDARDAAEKSWSSHKAPMAAYWKSWAVNVRHFSHALRCFIGGRVGGGTPPE